MPLARSDGSRTRSDRRRPKRSAASMRMGRHDSHQRDRVPLPLWGVDGGRGGVEDAAGFVDIIRVNDEGNARHLQRRVNTTAVVGAHERLDVRGLENGLRETGLNGTQERAGDNKI